MTEKEKEIMNMFGWIIPRLTERGKDNLLSFGEGMVCIIRTNQQTEVAEQEKTDYLEDANAFSLANSICDYDQPLKGKQLTLMEYDSEKII